MKQFMKFSILLISAYSAHSTAFAGIDQYPQHSLVLYDEASNKKLTVTSPEQGTMAEIAISSPQEANQPEKTWMETRVSSEMLEWSLSGSPRKVRAPFLALHANLGRSGELSVTSEGDGNCIVVSSLREYFYPRETTLSCTYFFAIGPKPGFSGSN